MREMRDSGVEWIGEVPADWEIVPIKADVSIGHGSDPVLPGEVPVWGSGNKPFKTCGEYKEGPVVLLGRKGTLDCPQLVMDRYWNVDTAFDAKIKSNKLSVKYFYYVATCVDIKPYMTNTAKPSMTQFDWDNSRIPRPPMTKQERIVSYLDERCAAIDEDVAKRREVIEKLREYKKSLIAQAVTEGLDPNAEMRDSGVEWIGEVPTGWRLTKIGQVYDLRNTKVSDCDYEPLSVTMQGIVPQLDTAAKTDAHDDRKLVKEGDFVINSRSDRRGSCGIARQDGSVSLINTVLIPRESMEPRFYDWLFHTSIFADEFYKNGHGIVDDLWTTKWSEMKGITIVEPPIDVQASIADFLDERCVAIDEAISRQEQLIEKLGEYRKSIIHHAVTGKIDCTEA